MLVYGLYLLIATIILGPFGELPLPFPAVHLYAGDIVVFPLACYWLVHMQDAVQIVKKNKLTIFFLLFCFICIVSLIFSPIPLQPDQKFVSFLYLVRLLAYFSIFLTARKIIGQQASRANQILGAVVGAGVVLCMIGWIQYFLYPDLRNLSYLGWDPHYKRIFATYFDPNFLGIILTIGFLATLQLSISSIYKAIFSSFLIITILFTYSRSTFIALFGGLISYVLAQKQYTLFTLFTIGFVTALTLLPRPAGEGVKLERLFTIEARLGNWNEAIDLIKKYPLLGVGFNTLRFGRDQSYDAYNHAASGFDNSFLFTAATTGVVGLIAYLLFIIKSIQSSKKELFPFLAAIIIHSFFINTLFFPWVMVLWWILLALYCNFKENK